MIIEKVDPSRESFSAYDIDGTILTIGGVVIDLALEEGDQQVMIQFGSCQGRVHRDLMPCCEHVADVIIPPRKYRAVEIDTPPQGTTRSGMGVDEESQGAYTETVPVSLDMESVVLSLWPLGDMQITTNQEEEYGSE